MRYPVAPQAYKITCYIIMACYNFLCMKNAENIKLIASDIDDTLIVGGGSRLSPRNKEALLKAQEKGIKVVLISGRHYKFLHPSLFEDLPMDVIGTINGACLTNREGKTIAKFPMPEEMMNVIVDVSIKHDIGVGFKFEDNVVTYANHQKFIDGYLLKGVEPESLVIDDSKERKHHLEYGLPLGTFLIGDVVEAMEEYRSYIPDLIFASSFRNGYDVYAPGVSKATAIEKYLEIEGLDWSNVIAFGDAGNDAPMIEKAGIGVAMGNSRDGLEKVADIIAKECKDDGFAKALEELKII